MKQSPSIAKLAPALVAVHKAIRTIGYDATNPFFKSKYASLTTILETVRPILADNGLALVQGSEGAVTNQTTGAVVAVDVSATIIHESGEWITTFLTVPVDAEPIFKGSEVRMPTPQTLGSAVSYGRRYVVSAILALATDEDTDGNHPARDPRSDAKPSPKPEPKKVDAKPDAPKRVPSPEAQLKEAYAMPFPFKGEHQGVALGNVPMATLTAAITGALNKDPEKYADFLSAAGLVASDRSTTDQTENRF